MQGAYPSRWCLAKAAVSLGYLHVGLPEGRLAALNIFINVLFPVFGGPCMYMTFPFVLLLSAVTTMFTSNRHAWNVAHHFLFPAHVLSHQV